MKKGGLEKQGNYRAIQKQNYNHNPFIITTGGSLFPGVPLDFDLQVEDIPRPVTVYQKPGVPMKDPMEEYTMWLTRGEYFEVVSILFGVSILILLCGVRVVVLKTFATRKTVGEASDLVYGGKTEMFQIILKK